MVFLLCKSLEVTYGFVKNLRNLNIYYFAFNEPKNDTKNHHFVCKTAENEQQLLRQNYFRSRHPQLLSFPGTSEDRFEPHFAYLRALLNIFEQNEWQIRFSQPILL